jgi:hypothetical protein
VHHLIVDPVTQIIMSKTEQIVVSDGAELASNGSAKGCASAGIGATKEYCACMLR